MQRCKVFETENSKSSKTNYKKPPIPLGFEHVCGEWNNGFVVECRYDRSQFVWVPVGSLKENGTLDGSSFSEKFGRRPFKEEDEFSTEKFHEPITEELAMQIKSVKKYGGFYISRYCISKYTFSKKPMSVKGNYPWNGLYFAQVQTIAKWFDYSNEITSHLMYGAEYDTLLEWIIESGAKTRKEVGQYSSTWGNYWNCLESVKRIAENGSNKEWSVNNIFDLAGNVKEWTQECFGEKAHVLRGGSHYDDGVSHPVAKRTPLDNSYIYYGASFRVTLCLK